MTEFTYIFRGRETATSPDQMQNTTAKWVAWFKDLGAQGFIQDMGHPLEHNGVMLTGKQKSIVDGPFAEAKDVVGGFSVIRANDLAHATELAKGCPILDAGGSVEIRPVLPMPER